MKKEKKGKEGIYSFLKLFVWEVLLWFAPGKLSANKFRTKNGGGLHRQVKAWPLILYFLCFECGKELNKMKTEKSFLFSILRMKSSYTKKRKNKTKKNFLKNKRKVSFFL
jgi:hypothetical protein